MTEEEATAKVAVGSVVLARMRVTDIDPTAGLKTVYYATPLDEPAGATQLYASEIASVEAQPLCVGDKVRAPALDRPGGTIVAKDGDWFWVRWDVDHHDTLPEAKLEREL